MTLDGPVAASVVARQISVCCLEKNSTPSPTGGSVESLVAFSSKSVASSSVDNESSLRWQTLRTL